MELRQAAQLAKYLVDSHGNRSLDKIIVYETRSLFCIQGFSQYKVKPFP